MRPKSMLQACGDAAAMRISVADLRATPSKSRTRDPRKTRPGEIKVGRHG